MDEDMGAAASEIPDDLWYTEEHQWLRVEDGTAIIGITARGQCGLGDVASIELPEKGDVFHASDELAVVEAAQTSVEVYSPVSGKVVEVNRQLAKKPGLLNRDPYGLGWIVRMRLSDPSELEELLSPEDYGHVVDECA